MSSSRWALAALVMVGWLLQGCGDDAAVAVPADAGAGGHDGAPADLTSDAPDAPAPDLPVDVAMLPPDGPAEEAATDTAADAAADAPAPFACGPPGTECRADQYCVLMHGGAFPCRPPATDGGCSAEEEVCQSDPTERLLCRPSDRSGQKCEDLPASCPFADPCRCLCRGACFRKGRFVTCQNA